MTDIVLCDIRPGFGRIRINGLHDVPVLPVQGQQLPDAAHCHQTFRLHRSGQGKSARPFVPQRRRFCNILQDLPIIDLLSGRQSGCGQSRLQKKQIRCRPCPLRHVEEIPHQADQLARRFHIRVSGSPAVKIFNGILPHQKLPVLSAFCRLQLPFHELIPGPFQKGFQRFGALCLPGQRHGRPQLVLNRRQQIKTQEIIVRQFLKHLLRHILHRIRPVLQHFPHCRIELRRSVCHAGPSVLCTPGLCRHRGTGKNEPVQFLFIRFHSVHQTVQFRIQCGSFFLCESAVLCDRQFFCHDYLLISCNGKSSPDPVFHIS